MPQYQILYWHNIPVQVRVRDGRKRISKPLPDRFQDAADKAAMRAGHAGADNYSNGFRWGERQERQGTPGQVADSIVAELDLQYPTIDWQQTAAALKSKS